MRHAPMQVKGNSTRNRGVEATRLRRERVKERTRAREQGRWSFDEAMAINDNDNDFELFLEESENKGANPGERVGEEKRKTGKEERRKK